MKKLLFFTLFLSIIFPKGILASGFNLQKIGNLDVTGKISSHWWYSGNDSTMQGESESGSEVTVDIDGIVNTVTTDESGTWTYSSDLSVGDHLVKLSSGGSEIAFTLTLGNENVDWDAVESGSGEVLPAAGNPLLTVILLGVGMVLILGGRKLYLIDNKY